MHLFSSSHSLFFFDAAAAKSGMTRQTREKEQNHEAFLALMLKCSLIISAVSRKIKLSAREMKKCCFFAAVSSSFLILSLFGRHITFSFRTFTHVS